MQPWHYIVLVGAVLLVYALMKPGTRQSSKPATTIQEIENTMDLFTAELEEENRQLIELVSEMKQDHDRHSAKLQGRLEALERQNMDVSKQMERLLLATEAKQRQDEAMSAAAAAAVKDQPVAPLRSIPHRGELDHVQSASEVMAPDKPLKQEGMNIRYRYTE
ncbi:MAG: hypothetical protein K0Q81_1961, partial [Paenibacillus sp.]|nr:hypothetical protein [Paenibacillus sp.]